MAIEKTAQTELPLMLGAFKPVGRVVVALANDEDALRMAEALKDAGFVDEDVDFFPAKVMTEELDDLLPDASGAAGFGWEIQSMRHYLQLAQEGCGWLIVRAKAHDKEARVAEIAKRHNAKLANKYNMLTVEELL